MAADVWDLLSFPSPRWAWAEQQPCVSILLFPPVGAEAQGFNGRSSGAVWSEEILVHMGKASLWERTRGGRGFLKPVRVQEESFSEAGEQHLCF